MKKIFYKVRWLCMINFYKYIFYNYFSNKIDREKGVYVVPYKGAVLQLDKGAKIYLKGKNLVIGENGLRGSKAETYVRLKKGAVWNCKNGATLCYNACVEIHEEGKLDSGYFYMNTRSTLIATKQIMIGEDVWMGRNVVIYDSDFHRMLDSNGNIKNQAKDVVIGDHVWLTNQIMVQKGTNIGTGTVVSPFTCLRGDIPQSVLVVNGMKTTIAREEIHWSSKRV